MAMKRKYSLGETTEDVLKNIASANKTEVPDIQPTLSQKQKVVSENLESKQELSPEVEPDSKPEAADAVEEKVESEKKTSAISSEKKNNRKEKPSPSADEGISGNTNVRNVNLDDETLWRLDAVKNKLNRSRGENDPFVTQNTIIRTALIEWLNANYPDTKKAYQIINNL